MVGLLLLSTPGCLSYLNPIKPPTCELRQNCEQIPTPSRQRVYVVLINGSDPLCCGNLTGVREYLNSLGFVKSYFAQLYHEKCLLDELREVRLSDPDARFAIVGFEHGAGPARKLANKATEEGMPIDLLVYLQPKLLLKSTPEAVVPVRRLITIQTEQASAKTATELEKGEIISVPCWSRYGVPTHPAALELLATELSHLAMTVTHTSYNANPKSTLLDDPAPSPRAVTAKRSVTPDQWDFLLPVSRWKAQDSQGISPTSPPILPSGPIRKDDSGGSRDLSSSKK